jgi:hypothetical protein
VLSELNKERIHRLIAGKNMTPEGLNAVSHAFDKNQKVAFTIAPDILKILKQDPEVWKNFRKFPSSYKRIRIGWIEAARTRPKPFSQRLRYFLKMTAKNKKYGMLQ